MRVSSAASDDDTQDRVTTLEYPQLAESADWYFPKALINPAGHRTELTYHKNLGVLAAVRDPNGVLRTFEYDTLGRPRFSRRYQATVDEQRYVEGSQPFPMRVVTVGSDGAETEVLLDRLGRPRVTRREGFNGVFASTETNYDSYGRVENISHPHLDTEPARLAFEAGYDRLDRPLFVTRDSWRSFTEYQYSMRTVKRWEESIDLARPTEQEYDAAGRLVRSTIFIGPGLAPANTTYAYGPFDTLNQVTDANGNKVVMEYDNLGRYQRSSTADITGYLIGYNRFDDNTFVLGSDVQLFFIHDKLGRPLTRASLADASYNASWRYDEGIGAIGQLTKSQSARVTKNYGFDPYGRLEEIEWRIDDQPRSIFYSFDEHDRLRLTSYPPCAGLGPMEFENVYDGAGLLTKVRRLSDGFEVWRVSEADAAQNILTEKLNGDRVETKYTYHPDQLVKTIQTTSLRGREQSVEYAYNANGNPAWRKDLLQPAAHNLETFAHDSANRLTSAQIGGQRREWAYDPLGNIVHSNESGLNGCEWKYGGVNGPHRLTSILCDA